MTWHMERMVLILKQMYWAHILLAMILLCSKVVTIFLPFYIEDNVHYTTTHGRPFTSSTNFPNF